MKKLLVIIRPRVFNILSGCCMESNLLIMDKQMKYFFKN